MTFSLHGNALQLGLGALASALLALGCSSSDASHPTNSGSNLGPAPELPAAPDVCPALQTTNGIVHEFGVDLQMWVGDKRTDKKGPVLFYWHGTSSVAGEILAFMRPMVDEIQAEGGIAVSFDTSIVTDPTTGRTTGNNVWFVEDYSVADAILGCAVQQLNIDTRRIYAAGCSAGGLQSGSMVLARSSYLAGAMPNSGGDVLVSQWETDAHTPSVITAHGTYANDFVVLHFADWSMKLDQAVMGRGGYAVDCTHPNGHCIAGLPSTVDPSIVISDVMGAQWQFLKDHPFGITMDPYASGLPSSFPSYCQKVSVPADQ